MTPLFHRAYGEAALRTLPPPVVAMHEVRDVRTWHGRATVTHGTTRLARLANWILRFPPAGRDQELSVRMCVTPQGEMWTRRFDGRLLVSYLEPGPAARTIRERLGPISAISRMATDATGVDQPLLAVQVLGLPIPASLRPRLDVREGTDGARYTFRMRAADPWGRLLIAYEGWLDTSAGSADR